MGKTPKQEAAEAAQYRTDQATHESAVEDLEAGRWHEGLQKLKTITSFPAMYTLFQIGQKSGIPDDIARDALQHAATKSREPGQDTAELMGLLDNYAGSPKVTKGQRRWLMDFIHSTPLNNDFRRQIYDKASYGTLHHLTPEGQGHNQAAQFWHDYEKHVTPHHFATLKANRTGYPEDFYTNHRGERGNSRQYENAQPHLTSYASRAQQAVQHDLGMQSSMKNFKGKPHIKVYRGVAGDYAHKIGQSAGLDEQGNVDNKILNIPVSELSSWSTNPKVAQEFAGRKLEGQSDKGLIMEKWMPLHDLLHSGRHDVVPGQIHAHEDEDELIFGHDKPHVRIPAKNLHAKYVKTPDQTPEERGYSFDLEQNARAPWHSFGTPYTPIHKVNVSKNGDHFGSLWFSPNSYNTGVHYSMKTGGFDPEDIHLQRAAHKLVENTTGLKAIESPEGYEDEPKNDYQPVKVRPSLPKAPKLEKSEGIKQISSVAAFQNSKLLFGLRRDNKRWSLPGGHLEAGESPTKAAVRELMEEANLKPLTLEYLGSGEVPGHEIHAFKADVVGTPAADLDPDEEFGSFLWVDPDNIPPEVQNNLHSPKNVTLQLLGIQKSELPLNKAEEDEENEVDRLLENPSAGERMLALKLNSAQPRHYLKALDDVNIDVRRVAIDQAEKTGHIRPVIDKLFQMDTFGPGDQRIGARVGAAIDYVLYSDSLRKHIEPENLRTLYKNNPNWGSKLVERGFDTPPDVLHDILNDDPYNAQYVLNHPNAPESFFTQVGEDPNEWNSYVVASAFRSPKMPQKYIENALRNVFADSHTAEFAVQNPNVPEHAAHELFTRALVNRENPKVSDVRKIYLQTHVSNIPEKVLDLAIDDLDIDVVNSTLQSPLVNNRHIKRLIDRGLRENNPGLVSGALYHNSAKPEDLTKALKEGSPDTQKLAIRYAAKAIVQPEHIEHALRSPDQQIQIAASDRLTGRPAGTVPFKPEYAHALVENPNAEPSLLPNFAPKDSSDPSFFDKALNHPNERIRWAAAEAPQLTPEQVEKVSTMGDLPAKSGGGANIAAQHPNASPELLQRLHAQYPAEEDIQSHIAANPRTPEHILKGMVDDPKYTGDVLQNKGLKPEFIHELTQTHPKWKSFYAIHPNTAPHTLEDIYNKDPLQRISILSNQNTPSNLVHRALVEAPTKEPVTGRMPTDFAKKALVHRNVSVETLKEIGNNEKKYGGFTAEKARDKLARLDPDQVHDESVGTRFGQTQNLNKLRKVRDWIQSQGVEEVHQKKLPPGDYKAVQHNGKVSAQSIDNYINSHEPIKYNVSHSQWNGAQRHNRQASKVFQLNLTTDQVNKMKAAGVKDFFDDIHASSRYSGHPVTPTTIGWVRYTDIAPLTSHLEDNTKPSTNPNHKDHGVFIDEIQSDLGQSLVKQIHKQAKEAGHSDEAAQKVAEDSKQKLDTIHKIVFQGRHPSEVLGEGFLQHLRDKGLHDKPVHIHTPESKAPISLGNQTKDVPVHFKETYKEWPKKSGMEPSQYGDLPTQTNEEMKGQPTQGGLVRKYEEDLASFLTDIGEYEILEKMGAMARLAPFNPRKDANALQVSHLKEWQLTAKPDYRNILTPMHPNAKARVLQKLGSRTLVRKNPNTGMREFLLYRGMSDKERAVSLVGGHINHLENSSWTPSLNIATGFENPDSQNDWIKGSHKEKRKPVGAWIPESHILHTPNMYLPDSRHKKEEEVIVAPNHNSEVAAHDIKWQPEHLQNTLNSRTSYGLSGVNELKWQRDNVKKSEQNLSQISPDSELIQDILGFNPSSSKIFDAARFLSGNTTVSLDKFRQALYEEDDLPSAALKAFGLEITPDNLKALESIQSIQHLNKNEQPCTAQSVVAGTSSGKDVTEQLKASFKDHFVVPVTLGGKHSAGSMLARDNEKATTWLLKPGVGGSPAAGVDEEPAPQATREAAFYAIAKAWGLGNDIPRTELMIIDGAQYAAIELLPWNYRNLDKLDKQSVGQARKILEPYRISGQLYKWAILDYVLGNADSHLQNTLASPEGKVYLIDHGSAFAGLEFDPAVDKNSFVPGYLRAWAPKAFHRLPIAEKLKYLPSVPEDAERHLRAFLGALDAKVLEGLLGQYSISTEATLLRLAKLKFVASSMPVWQAIQKLWVIP